MILNKTKPEEKLKADWLLLYKASKSLRLSFDKCEEIIVKDNYSFDELESLDSLTLKFSRTPDIFTHKILRSVESILSEHPLTFIDKSNFAEKSGLIDLPRN